MCPCQAAMHCGPPASPSAVVGDAAVLLGEVLAWACWAAGERRWTAQEVERCLFAEAATAAVASQPPPAKKRKK